MEKIHKKITRFDFLVVLYLYSRFSFPLAKICYFVYYGISMEAFVFLKKKDAIIFLKRWKNQKCSSPSEKNYWRRKPNSWKARIRGFTKKKLIFERTSWVFFGIRSRTKYVSNFVMFTIDFFTCEKTHYHILFLVKIVIKKSIVFNYKKNY